VFAVGDLVRQANLLLEGRFAQVWVEGEIVGLKVGSSGHAFFTLKDDVASLPTAMWRSDLERLRFRLEDGQKLRVRGRLGIFVKQGRFQLYADRAEPAGLGALMLELEQRKKKLAAEGLFDPARKRPLPRWPRCIGVVTSAHGAALHDILKVAHRRCPSHIVISPAVVQGPEAAGSIRRALARLVRNVAVDVVIVGRGGGAMEDLWAFNDEALARAIAACPVPVVSAVGHEVDTTICDAVADVRAATPSQAAELVVPDRAALLERLEALEHRMVRIVERAALDERSRLEQSEARLRTTFTTRLAAVRARLREQERVLALHHPRVRCARDRKRLDLLVRRLHARAQILARAERARLQPLVARLGRCGAALPRRRRDRLAHALQRLRRLAPALAREPRLRLARAAAALDALSPLAVPSRGYAIVQTPSGEAVRDASRLHPGDDVGIRFHRGRARAKVTHVENDDHEG